MSEENENNENEAPNYEELASKEGWVPKEQWEEAGKDPNEWTSAKRFHKTGESIKANKKLHEQVGGLKETIETMANQHHSDIAGLKTFQSAQLNVQRQELMSKRSEAIESADSEEVAKLEKQIHTIDSHATNVQQTIDPAVTAINTSIKKFSDSNSWVNDTTAKGKFARAVMTENMSTFTDIDQCLEDVLKQVNDAFPDTNENREKLSMTSKGGKTNKKQTSGNITMKNLDSSQQEIFNQFYKSSDAEINKANEKEFLKQVNLSEA